MNLNTTYMGFELPHPLMPGASPIAEDLDLVRRYEDAGASALVMYSLFEEQIVEEQLATAALDTYSNAYPEALSYFPADEAYHPGPDNYLDQIRKIKEAVDIPVVASLNGSTPGGWLKYARLMEEAGADALELNLYFLAADPSETPGAVEDRFVEMLREVKRGVGIPVAVKMMHFHTAIAHFAHRLSESGADGLVIFNRFYQPDIDIEELDVMRTLTLSQSQELLVRLQWLAILHGRVSSSLAVTGGVHSVSDVIKAVMAGADGVQMVSALLRGGPEHLRKLRRELEEWMEEHEYDSLAQMKGSMSLLRCPDPKTYERVNYMQVLKSWRGIT